MNRERNYRPLAIAQNEAQWGKQVPGSLASAVPDRVIKAFEESAHRNQIRHLEARRERLETAIAECRDLQPKFLNHPYFKNLRCGGVMSTDEAAFEVLAEIAYQKRLPTRSRDAIRIEELKEALVFARYFRRFSRAVWARRAA